MQSQNLKVLASKFGCDFRIFRAFVLALPAWLLFCFDVFDHHGDLAPQVACSLSGAQLVHSGLTPYIDFWDWSQPVIYFFAGLPYVLNSLIEKIPYYIPPEQSLKAMVILLALLSLYFSLKMLSMASRELTESDFKSQVESLFMPISAAYVLALFCTRFELGVSQQLFMLFLLPWLILRWLNYNGWAANGFWAYGIGCFAALGAILDLPHLPLIVLLEVFFVIAYGKFKIDFAVLGLTLVSVLDLGWLALLPAATAKAYWQWTLPIRARQFTRFDATLSAYAASPDRRDALYVMVAALFLGLLLQIKQDFLRPLMVLTALGFALYVGEGEGLSCDLTVAIWGSCFIGAVCLPIISSSLINKIKTVNAKLGWALPAAAVFIAGVLLQAAINRDRDLARSAPVEFREQGKADIFEVVNNSSKMGQPVIILSDYQVPGYPLLFDLDRSAGSYLLWSRPLRVLNALNHFGLMTDSMRDFEKYLYRKLENDIRQRHSPLILVAKNSIKKIVDNSTLGQALSSAYDLDGECFYCSKNKAPEEFCAFDQGFDIYRRRSK